jgi:hypothetical protein
VGKVAELDAFAFPGFLGNERSCAVFDAMP